MRRTSPSSSTAPDGVPAYRIVVVRKLIDEERGQRPLGSDFATFSTSRTTASSQAQVVRGANNRCSQENLIDEIKNGVRALHAPLNTLDANWAYMVIASLAWSIKAWAALYLPAALARAARSRADRILHMDFRRFVQPLSSSRPSAATRAPSRLPPARLAPDLPTSFRLLDAL